MNWLHRLLNPHCEHCAVEKICPTCEVYKTQLDIANQEKLTLLNKLTASPEPIVVESQPPQMTRPRYTPWRVKQQQLEDADRKVAERLRQNAPKPSPEVEKIEKELGLETVEE